MKKRIMLDAGFTVEASFVMPLVLWVQILMVFALIGCCDRCTAHAGAVRATLEESRCRTDEGAEERMEKRAAGQPLALLRRTGQTCAVEKRGLRRYAAVRTELEGRIRIPGGFPGGEICSLSRKADAPGDIRTFRRCRARWVQLAEWFGKKG